MALSAAALLGQEGPKTMKLLGSIQRRDLNVLVDYDSSHTFLSQQVAQHLEGATPVPSPLHVQAANGSTMQCSSHIQGGSWSIQGCQLKSDLKILPLQHFDLILGMDWLESFSPMKVHWKSK